LIDQLFSQEDTMQSLKLAAAAALVATTIAGPAMARSYCDNHRCYHRGPVGAAADVAGGAVDAAAGIAGAAVGTAGAIATAPFRNTYAYDNGYNNGYNNGYDYYSDPNNNFACRPGTWFKGGDGRMHPCQ
jgi:hypothetical protein